MNLRLTTTEMLEDVEGICMKQFKIGSQFELILATPLPSDSSRKVYKLKHNKKTYQFTEYEYGLFNRTFVYVD